jgi:hypothetical protein
MITHPERAVLLAHADGELDDDAAPGVVRHVAACAECSVEITSLRGASNDFASTLHALDADEPAAWNAPAAAPAEVIPLRPPAQHRAPAGGHGILRWAAGILLIGGAAASAAIVVLDRLADTPEPSAAVPTATSAGAQDAVAAVVATPLGGELRVAIDGAGTAARLYVAFDDDAAPTVAVTGTGAPRFTAAAGRVDIALDAEATGVRVTVPTALRTEITMNGRVVARVTYGTADPAAAADGTGIPLGLAPPGGR